MVNPFEIIIEKVTSLESKIDQMNTVKLTAQAEIIGREELCKRLDITEPTAIRWGKKGLIPCFRVGSAIRYNWPKVIESLEKQEA